MNVHGHQSITLSGEIGIKTILYIANCKLSFQQNIEASAGMEYYIQRNKHRMYSAVVVLCNFQNNAPINP